MSLIENYIASHSMPNVRYDSGELIRKSDDINQEFAGEPFPQYPQLKRQLSFLFDFIGKHFGTPTPEEKLQAFAEAVFAVKYAVDVVDFVPDFLPGGWADDSAFVCAVLQRNAAIYQTFAAEQGVDWAEIQPAS